MMVGHFISRLFEGTLHVDEIHMPFKMADVTHICTTRSSPPADRFHTETGGRFAFTWYRCEISYWSEILAPPSTTIGVNSRRGESHPNDILWWYHVKKCRAMKGNRSELAPARNVAQVSCKHSTLPYCATLHSLKALNRPMTQMTCSLWLVQKKWIETDYCILTEWQDCQAYEKNAVWFFLLVDCWRDFCKM